MAVRWSEVADRLSLADDPGMLLDVIVPETDQDDWRRLFDLLRRRSDWRPRYTEYGDPLPLPDDVALAVERSQGSGTVELNLSGMYVRGYLRGAYDIEFDVDPDYINSPQRFNALTELMTEFGRAVGKPVYVTPESVHELPVLSYDPGSDEVVAS